MNVRVTSIIFDSFTLVYPSFFSFFLSWPRVLHNSFEELSMIKFHGCKLHVNEQRFFD